MLKSLGEGGIRAKSPLPPKCLILPGVPSGLAVLRSPEPLALGRWHRVSAERLNKDGSLRVNGGRPVLRSSPGKSQGLNLHTLLYLGGVEPSVPLSPATNVSAHFHGCVGEVRSNLQGTGTRGGWGKPMLPDTCWDPGLPILFPLHKV